MPTTPVLMVDNVFDRINQYRDAVVTALSAVDGNEAWRVATYRRERQWWQAANDGIAAGVNNFVRSDLGVSTTAAVDYLYIDRGHNLWGRRMWIEGSSTGVTNQYDQSWQLDVPALGTVGGNPATGVCVTEEGSLYALKPVAMAARRYWRWSVANAVGYIPVTPGIVAGMRTQLLGYSAIFDEDAGGRKLAGGSAESDAGYLATGRAYSWRTLELDLKYIGATEYDATMRRLRKLLFERNTPFVACMDYTTNPERAWMYQYDGNQWGFPKSRVYRSGRLRCRELAPKLDG